MKYRHFFVIALTLLSLNIVNAAEPELDPAEVAIGERLFLETRFAQAYYANNKQSDPALDYTLTTIEPLRGPFAGKTMNCRACHMVDEHKDAPQAGMRTYADYTHHSPIPDRNDGHHRTERNSMSLVNISIAGRYGKIFHFDGEFNSMEDLVMGTLTGRNYGWLADESEKAIKHIASIIRTDDGTGELAREFGGRYRKIFTGTAKDIPDQFRLPADYRIDITSASDQQIFQSVAKLIAAYVNQLTFAMDKSGNYSGSPYDQFLIRNGLPRKPDEGETPSAYSQRLLKAVSRLSAPRFVSGKENRFSFHKQKFVFSADELKGMKLFFTRGDKNRKGGNCVSCHTAPHFSDFLFHNTGLTQIDYDENHGTGSFMQLHIPDLQMRNMNPDRYLPASAGYPVASSRFRRPTNIDKPGYTDLGLWNVFANPAMPGPQTKLYKMLCDRFKASGNKSCSEKELLPMTIAAFKTPVLRDLGHSNPYMHNGQFNILQEAVSFYITSSALAKSGILRNRDRELDKINIEQKDIEYLAAFLNSLNEDYE